MASTAKQAGPRYQGLRVTREEYLDLPDDGFRYDMLGGVLYVSPSGDFVHGQTYGRFFALLLAFLKENPVGQATLETDVFLPDGGDVLRPAVSFLLQEHTPMVKTHIHGAPDLVCEVLSSSTAARDLGEQAQRYLQSGVKELWILDPEAKSIRLWENAGDRWEKKEGDRIESNLLSGFTVSRADVF